MQKHGVDHREHGAVGSDAERQRQDDDDGEAVSATQAAKGELDVAYELVEGATSSHVADVFLLEFDPAEVTERTRSCRRW